MADEIFERPRRAGVGGGGGRWRVYDALDPDRSDLDVYVGFAE